jgi:thiamine monophosphate synthase
MEREEAAARKLREERLKEAEIRHRKRIETSQRKYSKICKELKELASQHKIEVVVNGRIY